MKTNHLFASAALAVALLGVAPAYSQILGGGAHGGLGGAFGAGSMGGSLNGAAGGSVHGGASGQFDDLNRTQRTVDAKREGATRAGTPAVGATEHKADAIAAVTRRDARQGEAQARKSGEALTGTAGAAARVAGAAQDRDVNAAGALGGAASAGTLGNTGVPASTSGPEHGANRVTRSAEPAPRADTKPSGNSGNASRAGTEMTRPSPPPPGSGASASASADASLSASAVR
jgi:hypothetical protein